MTSALLDTNVLVRFLVNDHKEHHAEATKIFSAAEAGKQKIVVPALVVAETVFVLQSFYKQTPTAIASALGTFLSQTWLRVDERSVLLATLARYGQGKHFVDAYLWALAKDQSLVVLTFDKQLAKESAYTHGAIRHLDDF